MIPKASHRHFVVLGTFVVSPDWWSDPVSAPWRPTAPEGLSVETLRVVLRRDHPLAGAQQVAFEDLRDTALVSLPTRSRTQRSVDAAATSAGFALRHSVTVGLPLTLFNLVSSGAGVAIVPGGPPPLPAFKHLVSHLLVKPILSSEVGISHLRERGPSPAAAGLLARAVARLARSPRSIEFVNTSRARSQAFEMMAESAEVPSRLRKHPTARG